ncbi:MAG: TIM barrel protein [Bacteroidota bacterium]
MDRRDFIKGAAVSTVRGFPHAAMAKTDQSSAPKLKGNIRHSVARWCYNSIPLEELLPAIKDMGLDAIDLIFPKDWPILQKYGIHCTMVKGAAISHEKGFNNPAYHKQLIKNYKEMILKMADAGYTNVICYSGNRKGMNDYVGLENCVRGLSEIMPLAEEKGVVLQMELFNQINHPDYMADNSIWGVELCRRLGSDSFKLLYDIYHMQIQEGDIIRTIQNYHQYFGHYHTGGVPGRHEIDDSQELYYPAIMKAILATGYEGYVAQEFLPARDPLTSLKEAVMICDV